MPTTLADVVRAYGALANDGMIEDLVWYQGQRTAPARRVMSPATARLITLFLSDPMARLPSFPRMGAVEYPFPVAVKTGTSQGFRDAWTVAYSRDFTVGVWTGRPDSGEMRGLGGSSSAAKLARAILQELHGRSPDAAPRAFPTPDGYAPREVCTTTGALAEDDCGSTLREWLAARAAPTPPVQLISATADATLAIATPRNGMHVIRNPEMPADLATLNLTATLVSSSSVQAQQVLWYVDDQPYRLAGATESIRWPLQPGRHRFQVRSPALGISSATVTVQVD
jgi:penicillin-binding protein 1C